MSAGEYKTIQGDTWDIICYRLYPNVGKEMCMDKLISSNSDHVNTVIFPAGVYLNVPKITESVISDLPPWKK